MSEATVKQRTLQKEVSRKGLGIQTGKDVK